MDVILIVLSSILFLTAITAMLAGQIMLIIYGTRRHLAWGLGMILLPVMSLAYVGMHWQEGRKSFLIMLSGLLAFTLSTTVLINYTVGFEPYVFEFDYEFDLSDEGLDSYPGEEYYIPESDPDQSAGHA